MDNEERERLQGWLAEKWHHGPCPVCLTTRWATAARLGQISNLDFEGGRIPVLVVTCQNCGYFVTVNALVAGLRPPGSGHVQPNEPFFVWSEDDEG